MLHFLKKRINLIRTTNLFKFEVPKIGSLKGVKVAICGIKCIDLTKKAVKILGVLLKMK